VTDQHDGARRQPDTAPQQPDGGRPARRGRVGPVLLALILVVLLIPAAASRFGGGRDQQPPATAAPVTTAVGAAASTPAAATATAAAPDSSASDTAPAQAAQLPPGPLPDGEVIRAAQAARRFAAAYATYRSDDPPDVAARRLAGLTTDEFAAELARSSAAAAARAEAGETAAGRVTGVRLRLIATDSVVAVVAVHQTITSPAGKQTRTRAYAVTVVPAGDGWAASAIADADAGDAGG
jgi:hypothetical protein